MTLTTLTSRTSFYGDGLTRSFPLPFKIWAPSDLKIYLHNTATLSDVLQNLNTDYTVDSGAPASFGGVTFNTPPPSGSIVVLLRDMPLTQELDLVASGAFAAENIEIQLDKLTAEMQTLRELIARSLRLPVGAAHSELALPEPTPARANQLLGVSSAGDSYDLKVLANLTLQTVSPFAAALLDDPDAATARATLGIGTSIDLNLLVPDTTGGASSDFVPFIDASEANASNKVPVPNFFSNAIAGSTATLPIDGSAFELLARKIADGSLHKIQLSTTGIGKQTIWVPAAAMLARASNGAAVASIELPTNKIMLRSLDFDPTLSEYAQFSIQMPKSWNEASLSAVFVWSHANAAANFNVVWGIRGSSVSDDDPLDMPWGASVQVTDTGGTANDLYRSPESSALTLAGTPTQSDVAHFEVFRAATDVADTLPVDARLHGIVVFYTTDANTDN